MVDIPRSSFIPRETSGAVPGRVKRRKTFHIFGFLATVVLVGSLALAAGVFFYEKTATKALANVKIELGQQKDKFDEVRVGEVRAFDRKLRAASVLLDTHIAPSKLFATLETETMARIQLMKFDFEYDPGYDVNVTLEGGTEEFKTVALQSVRFEDGKLLDKGVFAEVGTAETISPDVANVVKTGANTVDHKVMFTVEAVIPHSAISFDATFSTPPALNSFETSESASPEPEEQGMTNQ